MSRSAPFSAPRAARLHSGHNKTLGVTLDAVRISPTRTDRGRFWRWDFLANTEFGPPAQAVTLRKSFPRITRTYPGCSDSIRVNPRNLRVVASGALRRSAIRGLKDRLHWRLRLEERRRQIFPVRSQGMVEQLFRVLVRRQAPLGVPRHEKHVRGKSLASPSIKRG